MRKVDAARPLTREQGWTDGPDGHWSDRSTRLEVEGMLVRSHEHRGSCFRIRRRFAILHW